MNATLKNCLHKMLYVSLGLMSLLLVFTPAYAYLDLPTGSYILQFLLATLFAALLMVKVYWQKLRARLKDLFTKNKRGTNAR